MSVAQLAEVIGSLLAMAGVGVLLRLTGLLTADDARPINAIIVYVGLPAFIFRAVHPARLEWGLLGVALVAWAIIGVGLGVAYLAARALRLSRPATGGLMLVAALGNTGYIGYPLAQGLLGQAGLVRAVFYDVFGTVGALLTVGIVIAARMGRSGERPNLARELVTFPAVVALLLALATRSVAVPILVGNWLDALAKLVVPLIMISLGLSLRPRSIGRHAVPVGVAVGVKLLLLPLVALGISSAALRDPATIRLVVLQAGVPSMMLSLVFGARFELDTELISSAILVTTVCSILTIPLMQALVR